MRGKCPQESALGVPYRSALGFGGPGCRCHSGTSPGQDCDGEDQVTFVSVEDGVRAGHTERKARPRRPSTSCPFFLPKLLCPQMLCSAPKPLTFPHQDPRAFHTFSKSIFIRILKSQKFSMFD